MRTRRESIMNWILLVVILMNAFLAAASAECASEEERYVFKSDDNEEHFYIYDNKEKTPVTEAKFKAEANGFGATPSFQEGLAIVSTDEKTSFYVDYQGNDVTGRRFEYAGEWENGLAIVCEKGIDKYGIMNRSFEYVVDPVYECIENVVYLDVEDGEYKSGKFYRLYTEYGPDRYESGLYSQIDGLIIDCDLMFICALETGEWYAQDDKDRGNIYNDKGEIIKADVPFADIPEWVE
jgi:hypothetical protein